MMARSNEAFWWSLFSAGGVMAALFIPALIVVTGVALPFFMGDTGEAGYPQIHGLVSFWIVRGMLFGVLLLSWFHCAHRIRHILMDVGWCAPSTTLAVGCYGGATAGTFVTALLLLNL